jgi:HD-GYP domain-containing protein (c-di-GMP phosphodiesterase class II)
MFDHRDALYSLDQHVPLQEKLCCAHDMVKESFPFVARIAITLYDTDTRTLKTYLHSSGDDDPLSHYETSIDNAPSLKEILEKGRPRVVNNLVTFENGKHEHTRRIGRHGYAASYTMPIFDSGIFVGFLFFNAREADVFSDKVLGQIDVYGHLIALMVVHELGTLGTLNAALQTAGHITHVRDPETGSHLDRMSRYSRLIAKELAGSYDLNDEYIERVFMFAPLHDIGKIGIPDDVLLKPGGLDRDEMATMMTHARKGRQMIDNILANFGLDALSDIDVLRNIAEFHHEAVNGSGYPDGMRGDEIPLEARIVAVADVFDALTSRRCYKEAWSNEDTFATLRQLAGEKLDRDCVDALISRQDEVESIQRRFQEMVYD